MHISLTPAFSAASLQVVRSGGALTINGVMYDFGPLPEGATLPPEAINCDYIIGDVTRIDGALRLTLLLPIQRSVFLDQLPDIIDPPDGPLDLPVIKELEIEE